MDREATPATGDAAFDVIAIGSALLDVVTEVSPAFLAAHRLQKGGVQAVSEETALRLCAGLDSRGGTAGGSAVNTTAGLASLGARCAFVGKVRDDAFGRVFNADLRSLGVEFPTAPLLNGPPTGRCLVLVTPDAARTRARFPGASLDLGHADVHASIIRRATNVYLEGQLFDGLHSKHALRRAAALAHETGARVALALSDPACVRAHLADFVDLIKRHVDVLFASEAQIEALLGTSDADEIHAQLASFVEVCVITRRERGSLIVTADAIHAVPAMVLNPIQETAAAGDLYAGGFLFGLSRQLDLPTCGALGTLCAAEAIGHFGARPERSLRELAAAHGYDTNLPSMPLHRGFRARTRNRSERVLR